MFRTLSVKLILGSAVLASLSTHAVASSFGLCLAGTVEISAAATTSSSASYGNGSIPGVSCPAGLVTSLDPTGTVNPTSIATGLTTASLTVTQTNPSGGTGSSTVGGNFGLGLLQLASNSSGGLGAVETSISQVNLADTGHYAGGSGEVTVNFHVGGILTPQINGNNIQNYKLVAVITDGGSFTWESFAGCFGDTCGGALAPAGWDSFNFSNQTASGFDFTGTFHETAGQAVPISVALQLICQAGYNCDYTHTALLSQILPANATFTSDSGVLFTQQTTGTPEPRSWMLAMLGLAGVGLGRLRLKRPRGAVRRSQ